MREKEVNAALLASTEIKEMHIRVMSGRDWARSLTHCKQTWCKLLSGGRQIKLWPWAVITLLDNKAF